MKTLIIVLFFSFGFLYGDAQEILVIGHNCNYSGEEDEGDLYQFDPSNEAESIIKEILLSMGSINRKSFILKQGNVKNAMATMVNNQRYIIYSASFLQQFKKDAKTRWAAYSVLAHEIGHHLNGDLFTEVDKRKRHLIELAADKVSGSVLRGMGAKLEETVAGIEILELEGESDTHPSKRARKEAIINGWTEKDDYLKEKGEMPIPIPDTDFGKISKLPPSPNKGDMNKMPDVQQTRKEDIPNVQQQHQQFDDKTAIDFNQVSRMNLVGSWYSNIDYNGQVVTWGLLLDAQGQLQSGVYNNGIFTPNSSSIWYYQDGYLTEKDIYGNVLAVNTITWVDANSFYIFIQSLNTSYFFQRLR